MCLSLSMIRHSINIHIHQLWPSIGYNWSFRCDYTFYKLFFFSTGISGHNQSLILASYVEPPVSHWPFASPDETETAAKNPPLWSPKHTVIEDILVYIYIYLFIYMYIYIYWILNIYIVFSTEALIALYLQTDFLGIFPLCFLNG